MMHSMDAVDAVPPGDEAVAGEPLPLLGWARFDTAIGACAVGWTARGIAAVALPGGRLPPRGWLPRLSGAGETEPPPPVRAAMEAMARLLDGQAVDLGEVPLDLVGVPGFHAQVYEAVRAIPAGSTRTYGEVAALIGAPGSAQAVGQALGANPCPIVVPCHRVLAADGGLGGFSAPGGVDTKRQMLLIEGAPVAPTLW
jgi:methylated-DNA-[protein]-cysteine S-methyltransferase